MSGMLSQEDIDRLLNSGSTGSTSQPESDSQNENISNEAPPEVLLKPEELDALGEIGNICMGTSATTLFTLLGRKVSITTPKVTVLTGEELKQQYATPYVAVLIKYSEGVVGTNLMVLKPEDVKIITSLMMGNDGVIDPNEAINDLHLSAIGEAMNQMIGSAATSLAEMFAKKIDITPPSAFLINFQEEMEKVKDIGIGDNLVRISFQMQVGELINSEIMQIMPIPFAKGLTDILFSGMGSSTPAPVEQKPQEVVPQKPQQEEVIAKPESKPTTRVEVEERPTRQINVIQPRYESFEGSSADQPFDGNKDMLMEIPIDVTVELGKVRKSLKDLMSIGSGSLISLNKIVGEPLNICANGRCIAKGEVVVIDDSYAIRVTEIFKNK